MIIGKAIRIHACLLRELSQGASLGLKDLLFWRYYLVFLHGMFALLSPRAA
jgi:hypothetical protein